jgi:glucose-1-phosphate thymidylyltransferase
MMRLPYGQPFTVEAAHGFVGDATVLFGFPDVLFKPRDAFAQLLARRTEAGGDVVLGLFPARVPEKVDMVELDPAGSVRSITIRPRRTELRYTWMLAVWAPSFTQFLHRYVKDRLEGAGPPVGPGGRELYMGDVVQAALEQGMSVGSVCFDEGTYLDIGTPDDLHAALTTEIGKDP